MPAAEAVYAIAIGYVLIVLLERDSSQNRVGLVYIKLYCSAAFIGRAGVGHTTVPNTRKVCDHKEKEEDRNDSTYVALTDPTHTGLIKRPNYIAGQRLHTRKSLKQSDHRPIWILLYFHIENVGSPPFNYTVVLNRGIEKLLKYILPAYLLLYFLTAFFWRSYLVWKATGVNPFVLGHGDSAHDYIGKVFKVLFALVVVTVIAYSTSGRACEYLMPIVWLQDVGFKLAVRYSWRSHWFGRS